MKNAIGPEDEKCQNCGHQIDEHRYNKCIGVYNVYEIHGDETVGCVCKEFSDIKTDDIKKAALDALADIGSFDGRDLA